MRGSQFPFPDIRAEILGVILTSDEAVALGLQLLRLAGGPEPYG